jgi:AbrB family looped-hinge helix DNA binding protein
MQEIKMIDHGTIIASNRVTIPKAVMLKLNIKEGDIIGFFEHPEGVLIKKQLLIDARK